MNYKTIITIPLTLFSFSTFALATIYADGEDGRVNTWQINGNKPAGATVKTRYDNDKKSQVIAFKGDGRKSVYLIGGTRDRNGWKNSQENVIKWSMNFSEKFKISLYVESEKGRRVLYYDYRDKDKGLYLEKYIRMGLGAKSRSGKWVNFERNLDTDLKKYEPDNRILRVNGFKVHGSGRMDNIELTSGQPSPIDKEDGEVLRGPYLQQSSDHSIIVRWRTDKRSDSKVVFGRDKHNLSAEATNHQMTKEHEVLLANLKADKRYYYKVGNSDKIFHLNQKTFFRTAPKKGSTKPMRVWVLGDSGAITQKSKDVYTAYKNFTKNKETDLVLMLGDNAFKKGTDREYQRAVFDKYSALLAQTSLWSVYGNHDAMTPEVYFNSFTFPENGEVGGVASHSENYYSYDRGNIHFVVLDSSRSDLTPSSKMLKWLKKDLQENDSKWLISAWHHSPYTRGSYDSDTQRRMVKMRNNFLPTLEEYGVDLVLGGHSHVYERSKFIHGHYGKSSTFDTSYIVQDGDGKVNGDGAYKKTSKKGTVFVVLGSSGKPKDGEPLNHPVMVSESSKTYGSVIIDTTKNHMDVKYLTNRGVIFDSFRIQK